MIDNLSREDRVEVTFTDFYNLMKKATESELIANAVRDKVPHQYILSMLGEHPEIDVRTLADTRDIPQENID